MLALLASAALSVRSLALNSAIMGANLAPLGSVATSPPLAILFIVIAMEACISGLCNSAWSKCAKVVVARLDAAARAGVTEVWNKRSGEVSPNEALEQRTAALKRLSDELVANTLVGPYAAAKFVFVALLFLCTSPSLACYVIAIYLAAMVTILCRDPQRKALDTAMLQTQAALASFNKGCQQAATNLRTTDSAWEKARRAELTATVQRAEDVAQAYKQGTAFMGTVVTGCSWLAIHLRGLTARSAGSPMTVEEYQLFMGLNLIMSLVMPGTLHFLKAFLESLSAAGTLLGFAAAAAPDSGLFLRKLVGARALSFASPVGDGSFLKPGLVVELAGPSGCGKSALEDFLAGQPASGEYASDTTIIQLVDRESSARTPLTQAMCSNLEYRFNRVVYMPQAATNPLEPRPIGDLLLDAAKRHPSPAAAVEETAQALCLHHFGDNWRSMLASDLSGGQTQKVSIARFWLQVYREGSEGPAALILDEAFTSIDGAGAREAERLTMAKIEGWRARWPEMTVFFTTHDPAALFHGIKNATFRKTAAGSWAREDHSPRAVPASRAEVMPAR